MNQKLVKTNINIAGRSYPLKVDEKELAIVQTIEKSINTDLQSFQKTYPNMELRDFLCMTIIKLAFDNNNEVSQEVLDKVRDLQKLVTTAK